MDWLAGLNGGAVAGFGATGIVVITGVLYALAFQRRFTNRMEKQGDKDVKRIEKLERELLISRGETRASQWETQDEREYASKLRVQIIELGQQPHQRPAPAPEGPK